MDTRVTAVAAILLAPMIALIVLLSLPSQAAPLDLPPTVTGVAPKPAINDHTILLTITGTGFAVVLSDTQVISLPTVSIGATPLVDVGWVSSTTLTTTLPMGFPSGLYTLTVTNPDGQSGWLPGGLTVQNPVPSVQVFSPESAIYGQVIILTITGTSFVATPTVVLGSTPCVAVGYVSSTQFTATVSSDLLPGVYDLTVRNPGPGNPEVRLTQAFTLYSPIPTVTAIDPASALNDLDTSIVIAGTNFAPTPTVMLGTVPLENVIWVSMTQLTALVPWGMNPGMYAMTFTNPGPNPPSTALANVFTVTQGIGVWTSGGPYGGSIVGLAINPMTPTTMYATSIGAGLFRTRNGGQSWELVFTSTFGGIAELDPLAPQRIYMGRMEWGAGLYRSDDGGDTWIPIPVLDLHGSLRAFAHPTDAGKVYVALSDSGWCQEQCGFYMSTNYGQTWVTRTVGLTDTQVVVLAFHPMNPQTMYVGTAKGNVFRSTNGGDVWEFIGRPDIYISQLAVNPFGDHELWASVAWFGHAGHLWKYISGAWTLVSVGAGQDNWVHTILFSRNISGTIWIGASGGYKSTDGGSTWTAFGALERDVMALATAPNDSRIVYQGYRGEGVYKTSDDGATWQELNQGLAGIVPSGLGVAPHDPYTVYATSENSVFKTTNGGSAWRQLPFPSYHHGPQMPIVDPVTPTRVYIGLYGGLDITENDYQDWHTVNQQPPPQYASCCHTVLDSLIATTQPGHMVMGVHFEDESLPYLNSVGGGIYISRDYGETWSYVNVSQAISQVIALAFDPFAPTTVYAGTGAWPGVGTGLWKSIDGGAIWFPSGFSGQQVHGVAVDPGNSQTVYVLANTRFYVSHDAGQTWTVRSDSIDCCMDRLLLVPTTSPTFYVYGWGGMKRSTDGGQHWAPPAGGFANSNIGSMAVATTTDRVIVYVGIGSGTASATQAMSQASNETLVSAGVYRQTTRLLNQQVYLPLVLKK